MSATVETFVGFDSAWTDNARAPGAICAIRIGLGLPPIFHEPRLVQFAAARSFIDDVAAPYTLIAIDQPTIVPDQSGMRPAERATASVVSWIGGGVQPANRGRIGMFCDASPIWPFLESIVARDDPVEARTSPSGRYVMEVFPALALASFDPGFYKRLGAPKYNPAQTRKFDRFHWARVCAAGAECFDRWNLSEPAAWCRAEAARLNPRKADQDRLDAMLCLAIALHWRFAPHREAAMIGDLAKGYIVAPVSPDVRERLTKAAHKLSVAISR